MSSAKPKQTPKPKHHSAKKPRTPKSSAPKPRKQQSAPKTVKSNKNKDNNKHGRPRQHNTSAHTKLPIIRTRPLSTHHAAEIHSRATSTMSLTDLQFMARAKGIPFGGVPKDILVRKINDY